MSNIGEELHKRKITGKCLKLYNRATIRGKAANVPTYAAWIRSSYRISALSVACSYRTVSYDAICVISSMSPIDLLAQDKTKLYVALHPQKNVELESTVKKMARSLELVK